jgi:hypothetical protein
MEVNFCIATLLQKLATITTDRGKQFTLAVWTSFCCQLGINHIMTTAYDRQRNGLDEKSHRQLKGLSQGQDGSSLLVVTFSWILLGLHAALKKNSGISLAYLVLGDYVLYVWWTRFPSSVWEKSGNSEDSNPLTIWKNTRNGCCINYCTTTL